MKKIYVFLCLALVLFLDSCSNLSVDEEAALKADLPSDFDWNKYAEINKDIANSQIVFDVREKNKALSSQEAINNCVNLLKNDYLAETVYLRTDCPKQGWNKNEKCPGIYANNSSYNKPTSDGWECSLESVCWQGGWDELKDTLPIYLETAPTTINFAPVKTMCLFIPTASQASDVILYLNNFKLDSVLVIEHYNYMGRYDGRPYKYCSGQHGVEKTQDIADKRGTYYDYGKYTFCFDKNDQKIYVAQ